MKRLIPFMLFLFVVLGAAYAGVDFPCNDMIEKGIKRFNKGHYGAAKDYFKFCSVNCPELKDICDDYITRCEKAEITREQQRIAEIKRIENKNKRLIEERKKNRLVYLSVYDDLPELGLMSALKDGIQNNDTSVHFTNDSTKAYWIVRVAVNMFEEQEYEDDIRYKVNAIIEVQNAVEMVFKTDVGFVQDSDAFPKSYSISRVANLFYDSKNHHIVNEIEDKILEFLGSTKTRNTIINGTSLDPKPKHVAIYIDPKSRIADRLYTGLHNSFTHAGYNVLERNDEEYKKYENDEIIFQGMYSPPGETNTKGNKLGVDLICRVKIIEANDHLEFISKLLTFDSTSPKTVNYPRPFKNDVIVKTSSDIDRIQIVADVLAFELGLPVDAKELEKHINKANEQDSLRERKREELYIDSIRQCKISAFKPKKGELFLTGGAAVALTMRNVCYGKFKSTHQNDYANAANACLIGGGVCLATAIGVYIYHICDAWPEDNKNYASTKGRLSLNPVFTDESISLSMSIIF